MSKTISFSVGIAAHNEAENIYRLLTALLNQKLTYGKLEEIIVATDGCTDATVSEIKRVNDSRITLIEDGKRIGQAARQNQLFEICKQPVMVVLNGDVLPTDEYCLENLILPFLESPKIGLVGGAIKPTTLQPTLVSAILDWSIAWKNELFQQINGGDTIYLCHGRIRAFSKALYSKLRWPGVMGEDAYSYIFAKTHGFSFYFQPKSVVWFASPQSLSEHLSQSERFTYSKRRWRIILTLHNTRIGIHFQRICFFDIYLNN